MLQTSDPVAPSSWPLLDEAFFSRRPDVELRVYGFYGSGVISPSRPGYAMSGVSRPTA